VPSLVYPATSTDQVPSEGDPKQLQVSSDKASNPEAMASETDDSQNAFAELQTFLMNNLETPGFVTTKPCRTDRPTGQRGNDGAIETNRATKSGLEADNRFRGKREDGGRPEYARLGAAGSGFQAKHAPKHFRRGQGSL
jgi:hypothetical protein